MPAFRLSKNAQELLARQVGLAQARSKVRMLPFPTALGLSTGLHFITPVLVLLLIALLAWILGLNLLKWLNPPKKPDMVFALVQDTNAKPPENPQLRGEYNQRAGGKRKPDEELKPPEKVSTPSPQAQQQPQPQSQATPPKPAMKPQPQQQAQKPQPPQPQQKQVQKAPDAPKPSFKPAIATPAKAAQPKPATQSPSGPVASARQASKASPSSSPSPVQIASQGAISMSSPRSLGNTSAGSPQGGDAEDGVDVMADEDLGPVIAEVTRRIKRNWTPPRAAQTRRIVVRFILARDGRVLERKIIKSSGDSLSDDSALRAVDVSAPFRPFPPSVRLQKVPIEFTFDYNVLLSNPKASR
ncbi:MAG: TonB family protein [Vampirovibrionales bacterium]|nr:TonB family protein [Vampirovibrionales bacterium]